MNRRKELYLTLILSFLISGTSFSQIRQDSTKQQPPTLDSMHLKTLSYLASRFAIARPLNIEFSSALPYHYTLERQKNVQLPSGKITAFSQVKASTSYNFIRKQRWMLGGTLDLRYYNIGSQQSGSDASTEQRASAGDNYFYHSTSLNFTYFSRLFNKTTIFGSSFIAEGSQKGFERMRGLIYGTMILKSNDRTKMTAGAVLNIGPNSQIPALPIFTYEHKFHNDMSLDILLPKQIWLRKYFSKKARISVGAEMDQLDFFIYNVNTLNPSLRYEFQQPFANSGLMYERLLGESFILTLRSGVRVPFNGRFYEKNQVKDPIFKVSSDAGMYFNAGISLLSLKNTF